MKLGKKEKRTERGQFWGLDKKQNSLKLRHTERKVSENGEGDFSHLTQDFRANYEKKLYSQGELSKTN